MIEDSKTGFFFPYDMPMLTPDPTPPLHFFSLQIYTDLRNDQKIAKNRGIPRFRGKV